MDNLTKIKTASVASYGDGLWAIEAHDAAGREYTLLDQDGFVRTIPYDRAVEVANAVKAKGTIDGNLWSYRIPYGTAAWLSEGMEERQIEDERFGYY